MDKLLADLAKLTESGSDYAIAHLLGVSPDTIYKWQKRGSMPDDLTCFKIADLLGRPREEVLFEVRLAGEKNPKRRAMWEQLAGKAAAMMALSYLCLTSQWSGDANSAIALQNLSSPTCSERMSATSTLAGQALSNIEPHFILCQMKRVLLRLVRGIFPNLIVLRNYLFNSVDGIASAGA